MERIYYEISANMFEGAHDTPGVRVESAATDVCGQLQKLAPSSNLAVQLDGCYGVLRNIPVELWNTDSGRAVIAAACHDLLSSHTAATIIVNDSEGFNVKSYRGGSTWSLLKTVHDHVIISHENGCLVIINRGC